MVEAMASPIPYPVLAVLQRCHELESIMGQAYCALADAHAANPRMANLWAKTAKEEENHASQFSLAMSLGGEVMTEAKVDVANLDQAIARAKLFRNESKKGAVRMDDALSKAIELEEEMAGYHLHLAVAFRSGAHEKLFRAMMAADKGHISTLRAELEHLRSSGK